VAWVREGTIPTERPPLVDSANLRGLRVSRGQRNGFLRPYSRISRQEPLLFYQVAPQLYSRGWVDPVSDYSENLAATEIEPGPVEELWPLGHSSQKMHSLRITGLLVFVHSLEFKILYMRPVFTENFNTFTIFIFVLRLITCIGTTGRSTDVRHITSLRQVVYVQRIRCVKNSP
jgi:hypothetical protein